jgi:ABC-2 type transport system ATP-binding protein
MKERCMSLPLLQATELSHKYGTYQALAPTEFSLVSGQIIFLTGPNGAGKSTLLLCLSGLLYPTTGSVRVEDFDLYQDEREAKRRLAFVPDVPRFYTELTAWEHLQFMAMAHGTGAGFESRAEALFKEFNLWDSRDLFPHNYSRGMRLKLGLVMALIRPLKVLLLDEPTSAMDTEGIELVQHKLVELRAAGAAVLLSSHDQNLSTSLADQIWRMSHGQLETN